MHENKSPFATLVYAVLPLILLAGCNDVDSLTGLNLPNQLRVTSATITVDGQPVGDGTVFRRAQNQSAAHTRFEAHLWYGSVNAPGEVLQVMYDRPRGMANSSGIFQLHDDGTHGDAVAGDGIYCLEDFDGRFGFHHAQAHPGLYRYEFYGLHHAGLESNHLVITVTVAD